MKKYLIIIEKSETGFSAYSPDVYGCVAVGDTKKECEANMKEALMYHIELMKEKGYELPTPSTRAAEFVKIHERKIRRKEYEIA